MNFHQLTSKSLLIIFIVILVISVILQLAILTPGHNWGGDFAAYIMQAMSVVNGTADAFVQDNRFSMEQSSEAVGPVTYPWLFPLMLAPVYALTGLNIFALKLIGVLCYQIFLLILWFGFRHRLETHTDWCWWHFLHLILLCFFLPIKCFRIFPFYFFRLAPCC